MKYDVYWTLSTLTGFKYVIISMSLGMSEQNTQYLCVRTYPLAIHGSLSQHILRHCNELEK